MPEQIHLNFQPVGCEQWGNVREFIDEEAIPNYCRLHGKQRKYLATDLDLSPSRLKRKLVPADGDTSRFTTDDLELWLEKHDLTPLYYLIEKYAVETNRIEELEAELARLKGMKAVR